MSSSVQGSKITNELLLVLIVKYKYLQNAINLFSIILCHPINPQVRCGSSTLVNSTKHVLDLHLSLEALRDNAFAINMLCLHQDKRLAKNIIIVLCCSFVFLVILLNDDQMLGCFMANRFYA